MFQLLLITIDVFIRSLLQLTQLMSMVFGKDYPTSELISTSIWSVLIVSQFLLILTAYENASQTPEDISLYIHSFINDINDENITKGLTSFSVQFCQAKIQFDICGMFPFNYTLLYSVSIFII